MKKNVFLLVCLLFVFCFDCCFSQESPCQQEGMQIYQAKMQLASKLDLDKKPINEVIEVVGKSFIGTPYEGGSLEKNDEEERLIIHLTALDCTTFLENVLAIARDIKSKKNFENYAKILQKIRYRGGVVNKYPSRLHYFSDWIADNSQKKIIKNISQELGGEKICFHVDFMSHHPELYPVLKLHPEFVPIIARQERLINKRKYFYIPKDKLAKASAKIESGDLLAITTSAPGLDIGHVGIAVREVDGEIHLLHASSQYGKVKITESSLQEYLNGIEKDTGVIVLRVF